MPLDLRKTPRLFFTIPSAKCVQPWPSHNDFWITIPRAVRLMNPSRVVSLSAPGKAFKADAPV